MKVREYIESFYRNIPIETDRKPITTTVIEPMYGVFFLLCFRRLKRYISKKIARLRLHVANTFLKNSNRNIKKTVKGTQKTYQFRGKTKYQRILTTGDSL